MVSVQGLAYLSQLVIARLVGPADFGTVRTVEATLSIGLVMASAGMPSLAVKCIPEVQEPLVRGRLLGRLITIAVGASVICATLISLSAGTWDPVRAPYLRQLVWVIGLTAASRTCLNYFQGTKQIHRVSAYSIGLSALSLVVIVFAVWTGGLRGWILGRYLSEALFLGFSLMAVWDVLGFRGELPERFALRGLLTLGGAVAVSLLVRTAQDNAGLLAIGWSRRPAAEVGYYGVSTLLMLALMIVPGALGNLALPRIVERVTDPEEVGRFFRRLNRWGLLASVPVAGLCLLVAPLAIRLLLPAYTGAIPIIEVLLLVVPLRVLVSMAGTLLLAYGLAGLSLVNNLATLIVSAGLYFWLVPRYGGIGAAWGTLLSEALGAALYTLAAFAQLKRLSRQGPAAD
jgi:O-antigen/teichoic acid export membrane protein